MRNATHDSAKNNLPALWLLAVNLRQKPQSGETDKNPMCLLRSRGLMPRRYFFNASTTCGTTWNRSPTMP